MAGVTAIARFPNILMAFVSILTTGEEGDRLLTFPTGLPMIVIALLFALAIQA
jgi:hypothetical protein